MPDSPCPVDDLIDPRDPPAIRPSSTAEVAEAVAACRAESVAIVPVGGDTGLSGGTGLPTDRRAVRLSLERMNRILSVDPDRWTITAEAGVTIQALQEAAAAVGRQFAPDWGARGTATVGGAISTDAGGNNVVRYGNMREHVLGIEAVLPSGEVWDGRRALRKDSTGYDLKQLFIGGEGTLGVVTSAVLRLVPATPHRQSALAALPDLAALAPLVERARTTTGGALTALELMPDEGLTHAAARFGIQHPLPGVAAHHLLISLAAGEPVTDTLTEFLAAAATDTLIVDAVIAASSEQEQSLWHLRDVQSPTQSRPEAVEASLKYDAAVPVDRIVTLVTRVEEVVQRRAPGALAHAFGHVGDGNIHLWVVPAPDDDGFAAVRDDLRAEIDSVIFELDGTLSAEHGIGTLLRDRVGPQKSDLEWRLMRTIKAVLDPDDLLNPGKMLPQPGVQSS